MTGISEDAQLGQDIYDAIYEWRDEDFTVDKHLTRRVAQVLMDKGYRKRRDEPPTALEKAQAATERSLIELESKIQQAKSDAARIRNSGDENQYRFADMYERWSERAQRLLEEMRSKRG